MTELTRSLLRVSWYALIIAAGAVTTFFVVRSFPGDDLLFECVGRNGDFAYSISIVRDENSNAPTPEFANALAEACQALERGEDGR